MSRVVRLGLGGGVGVLELGGGQEGGRNQSTGGGSAVQRNLD